MSVQQEVFDILKKSGKSMQTIEEAVETNTIDQVTEPNAIGHLWKMTAAQNEALLYLGDQIDKLLAA